MATHTKIIPVKLPNDITIQIEVVSDKRGQDVAATDEKVEHYFHEITGAIEGIAKTFKETLEKIQPDKAAIEFGIDVGIEAGSLTALIAKGTANANMKLTLEWERSKKVN